MVLVENGITEIEGVPILDVIGTVVKTAEFLVDLKNIGVDRVNRGFYTRMAKDELMEVRDMYGVNSHKVEAQSATQGATSEPEPGCGG